ncbi:hypothetical protein CUMW_155010 [Citrus unshiu]|uniref:SAC3/GANP/THP3 conserved domain-containing protein n=1 Tax=Citrus unshiu TaxID=55188 RepID=A0A2H5PPD0_CITUN|nr:hypothetical protein CUMW_155010 [Citrus unshiu]
MEILAIHLQPLLLKSFAGRCRPRKCGHQMCGLSQTRSVRQDLIMQNIVNDKAINMFEKIVKFHVISHHKLRSSCSSSSISPLHYLNLEQLTKALTSLYNLYEANRSSKPIHEKEAEFRSFYVLLHLDSNGQPVGESLSLWFRHVPSPIIKSKEMWFARQALRYFQMGNYRRFLSTVAAEASYLQYCIIEPYIDEVRSLALCCIHNCCYKLHPYPLGHLSKVLMMETCIDEVGNKLLPTKQTTFCRPKGGLQNYSFLGFQQLGRIKLHLQLYKYQLPDMLWDQLEHYKMAMTAY